MVLTLQITRRLRELNVYSEMLPCTQAYANLGWKPAGIILSGGPYSVYEKNSPHADPAFFELGVPILGICYGLQEIAYRLGKENGMASEAGDFPIGFLGLSLRDVLYSRQSPFFSKC
jgi:GMP synthase (glutamine-hydrolysing)